MISKQLMYSLLTICIGLILFPFWIVGFITALIIPLTVGGFSAGNNLLSFLSRGGE